MHHKNQSQPGQSGACMTMCFAVVCMLICVLSIPVCDRELPPPPPIYVLFRTNARCHGFVDCCLTTLLYAIGHVTYVPLCNCWLTPAYPFTFLLTSSSFPLSDLITDLITDFFPTPASFSFTDPLHHLFAAVHVARRRLAMRSHQARNGGDCLWRYDHPGHCTLLLCFFTIQNKLEVVQTASGAIITHVTLLGHVT